MSNTTRLGANIRSLRVAFGETQEKLGEALFLEKNTISYYETGQREPNKITLSAIAEHFMVSVEELLHGDFTGLGKINVDKDAFWKNIDIILPIVSSEKAMQNENFKKAIETQRECYRLLNHVNTDGLNNLDVCLENYMEALEDDDIKVEAAANCIALWYLMMMALRNGPAIMKNRPAALRQVAAKDEAARRMIENTDSSFETDAEEVLSEIDNDEMEEWTSELLTAIKKSKEWSDLADYYLALQYVWNLVNNDLPWGYNQRIGVEMMNVFVSVKNIYAARYLAFNYDYLHVSSSQFVDDN